MRVPVLVTLAASVVVVAACGVGDEATSSGGSPPAPSSMSELLPATTVFVRPDAGAAPIESVAAQAVEQPCPVSDGSPDGSDGMMAETARLEPMLGQVLAYGGQHPDEFGTYGLVWHDGGDASVFISFTSDLDVHRAALEAAVAHPDQLIVCQVGVSGEEARAIQATLATELQGRFLSIGRGAGAIEVTLAPDEEELAGELLERYGSALDLRVGALAYPIERAVSVCTEAPERNGLPGLEIALKPPTEPLIAGGPYGLDLTTVLTNIGDQPIRFDSGIATGTLLDLDGNVVGSSGGIGVAAIGIGIDLAPGASTELQLAAGTSSCDPALGYVLAPGDYQIVISVPKDLDELVSAPVPITLAG